MEKILEVINLTKKYGDFTAMDNISFYVNKGELFGFLGPNGAGKKTTINMFLGMAKVTDSNFFRFPMIFLCRLFFPIAKLPFWIQPLSYLLSVA